MSTNQNNTTDNANENPENIEKTEKNEEIKENEENEEIENAETIESPAAGENASVDETVKAEENIAEIAKNEEIEETKEDDELKGETAESAEEKAEAVKKPDSMLKTAFVLGALTVITALLLAVLNSFTAPVIDERLKAEKIEAVSSLFGDGIVTEELQGYEDLYLNYSAEIIEVLEVFDSSGANRTGFCITVEPKGFNGRISMLVAVNADGTVKDTDVLTMSETAGQGTKIDDDNFILPNGKTFKEQFKSKSNDITFNNAANPNSIDTIANATVSSKAFLNGVNAALAITGDILSGNSAAPNTTAETTAMPESADTTTDEGGE
jgi:electron transport complex protein RnfG